MAHSFMPLVLLFVLNFLRESEAAYWCTRDGERSYCSTYCCFDKYPEPCCEASSYIWVVGVVVGGCAFVFSTILIICCVCRRRRQRLAGQTVARPQAGYVFSQTSATAMAGNTGAMQSGVAYLHQPAMYPHPAHQPTPTMETPAVPAYAQGPPAYEEALGHNVPAQRDGGKDNPVYY